MRFFRYVKFGVFLTALFLADKPQEGTAVENRNDFKTTTSVNQFFRENCICEENWACQCCVKYADNFFNVRRKLCTYLTIQTKNFLMNAKVTLNDAVLFNNTFSADNIPPLCFPIMSPLPITGCIKAHGLRQHDNDQIHACSNATLNFIGFNLLNFRLGCIDFGILGVDVVEPDHDSNTEAGPEISLETSDMAAVSKSINRKERTSEWDF